MLDYSRMNNGDESALIGSNSQLGKVLSLASHPIKFPRLKVAAIQFFSSFCLFLGIFSILTQISLEQNCVVRN